MPTYSKQLSPNVTIKSKPSPLIKYVSLILTSLNYQASVDEAIINLFLDIAIGKEIKLTFLDLVEFLNKENKALPKQVKDAASKCALTSFSGDLNEPLPAIVL